MGWTKNEQLKTYSRIQRLDFGNGDLRVTFGVYASEAAFRRGDGPIGQFDFSWGRFEVAEQPQVVDQYGTVITDAQPAIESLNQLLARNPGLADALDTAKQKLYELSKPAFENATVQ